MGHKADLPAYVVNDEALSLYVAGASGFKGWCLTVGSSEYGDYDVAARSGLHFFCVLSLTFNIYVFDYKVIQNWEPLAYMCEKLDPRLPALQMRKLCGTRVTVIT